MLRDCFACTPEFSAAGNRGTLFPYYYSGRVRQVLALRRAEDCDGDSQPFDGLGDLKSPELRPQDSAPRSLRRPKDSVLDSVECVKVAGRGDAA